MYFEFSCTVRCPGVTPVLLGVKPFDTSSSQSLFVGVTSAVSVHVVLLAYVQSMKFSVTYNVLVFY